MGDLLKACLKFASV